MIDNKNFVRLSSLFTIFITVLLYSIYFDLWYIASILLILLLILEKKLFNNKDKGFYLLSIGALIVITMWQFNMLIAIITLIALLTLFLNIMSISLNILSLSKFVILFSSFTIGIVYFIYSFRNVYISLVIFLLLLMFTIIYFKHMKLNLQKKYTREN